VASKTDTNVSSIFAAKLMELFEGFASVHGTHGEPTRKPDSLKWEIKSSASTVKKPVTRETMGAAPSGQVPAGRHPASARTACAGGAASTMTCTMQTL
jgi:hypothetical protein